MSSKSSKKLYTDDNPDTTIKGTGYKDEKAVNATIKIIKNRSIKYKKSVMITMYYRAKHHINQTDNMKKAMRKIKTWLKENKNERKYPYLDLDLIKKYEKLADIYNISRVSRGLEKSTKSDKGFLKVYKQVKGKYGKLSFMPIYKKYPEKGDYDILREKFINARLAQMKNSPLYYTTGKYKGLPTKQHLVLIMNAYSPDPKGLKKIIIKNI